MIISKKEIERLSADVRKIIDGQEIDLRDNREGVWSILKNDIYTLASLKSEQVDALGRERDMLKDTLADISHQIKTPLTSMGIMADLIENAPSEKQSEFIANIRQSLDRTEWLVSTLLRMAKLEAGAIEFSRAPISSAALIGLAAEPLQTLLDMKNQRIVADGEANLLCDSRWTAEALSNVLKNASEHSPYNSALYIQAGANPMCSWISVKDSGSGLAKAEIASLFKRFQGSRADIGYGIGLPLALAIMRSQNGDIEVDAGGAGVDARGVEVDARGVDSGATFTLKFFK
ncbi:MAG: HAMP domain-containing histidine kinase [Clostridiales bacterium]|jgi:signal transduction histidine kinase|nr:HAMP domain-containing histidine kinase [Clostridiales bacterium]